MNKQSQQQLKTENVPDREGSLGSWLEDLAQDSRYALRMLRRSPGFSLVAVLTVALGIGASTAVFTVINTFFLSSIPIPSTSNLVAVYAMPESADAHGNTPQPVSFPDLKEYRDRNKAFVEFAGYSSPMPISFSEGKSPDRLFAELVTGNYFTTLGLVPALGRFPSAEEDLTPGGDPVIVIGYGMWQRRFAGDPSVVGRLMYVNERPFTIIGVAPPAFKGINAIFGPDLWIPSMMAEDVLPAPSRDALQRRSKPLFIGIGKLRPGVSRQQAEADLKTIAARLQSEYPDSDAARTISLVALSDAALGIYFRQQLLFGSMVLSVIVALVLLIACSNVASLLLARAAARRQEIAVRLSLGAGRGRLIRQLLTESLLIAGLSGIVGYSLAVAGVRFLWSFRPAEYAQNFVNLKVNGDVPIFAIAVSLVSGLIFGIVPALESSRPGLVEALKEDVGGSGRSRRTFHLGNLLVVGQVALSLVALVIASLFLHSIARATKIDPGFETDHLAVFMLNPGQVGYDRPRTENFYREVRSRMSSQPGIASVSWASNLPLWGRAASGIVIEGKDEQRKSESLTSVLNTVDTGYFSTTGIAIVGGRDFTDDDRQASLPVAIVNQAMAARYWPDREAIGKRFHLGGESQYRQIVGIAKNANYQTLGESARPCIYLPLRQNFSDSMVLYVRTSGDAAPMLSTAEHVIHSIDPQMPIPDRRTGRKIMEQALWTASMGVGMLSLFGLLALTLASIGLYGLLSYSVNQRRREISIRMALGAARTQVLRLVLRQGMELIAIGILIGTALSLVCARALSSALYGVSAVDPASFLGASLVLSLVAALACFLPARVASKVDPYAGLRST